MSLDRVDTDEEIATIPPNSLSTYISPASPSGSIEPVLYDKLESSEYLLEPETYKYSTLNPVSSTDFTFNISPSLNPDTLANDKVTAFAA